MVNQEIINAPEKFDYSQLLVSDRVVVQQKTSEIRDRVQDVAKNVVQIGERLLIVKEKLPRGTFGDWLGAEFFWSERTAQNMMNVATQFKSANFADLNVSPSVLYLLSSNSTPTKTKQKYLPAVQKGEAVSWKDVARDAKTEREKTPPQKTEPATFLAPVQRAKELPPAPGEFDHLPEEIRPVFEEAGVFADMLNHLTQLSKLYNQASGGNIERDKGKPMACGTALAKDYQRGAKMIQDLRAFISGRAPENICVYCRGKNPKRKTCKPCAGGGWSTAFQWRTSTKQQREDEGWNK